MASLNKVLLCGNLTRDPEVRYTPSGNAVAELGLAVNERIKKENEWIEKPVFVDVVVWGRQAETSAEYLSKGSPVLIEGRLQLDTWESKEGEKRSKMRVRADRVQFLGGRGGSSGGGPSRAKYGDAPSEHSAPSQDEAGAAVSGGGDDDDLPF